MSRFTRFLRFLLLLLISAPCVKATNSSVDCNFNGTPIVAGSKIWFNAVMKITGTATYPLTIYFTGQTISSPAFTLAVPDAILVLDPSVTTATTVFNGTSWVTTAPPDAASFYFLSGVSDSLLASLPGSLDPVTWSGNFTASRPNIAVKWHMAAAVYTHFNSNLNNLGVKPSDCNSCSVYSNSHGSGSPENYLSYVIGGARGGGGNNYTGGYSGVGSVTPEMEIADTSVCVGGNITLTASTYGSWSSSNTAVATINASGVVHGVSAGTATITHSFSGCGSGSPQTLVVTVIPGSAIAASATPLTACAGSSVTLGVSGVGSGCTYSWHGPSGYSSAASAPVRSGLSSAMGGVYSVTVTSSGGCVSSATTPVTTVNQLPTSISASVVPTHVCAGSSFNLNGTVTGGVGYSLSWTGGSSTINNASTTAANVSSATSADAGAYTLTASVPGCGTISGNTGGTPLVVSAAPTSSGATNSGAICGGGSATLHANTSSATNWSWTGPGGYTSSLQNPVASPTATATYSLVASSPGSGCPVSPIYSTIVTVGSLPVAGTISGTANVCAGATSTLTNTVSGAWSSSAPATATISAAGVVTGITGGTATISFTASNSCGSATTTKVVTVNPLPNAGTISGAATACVGTSTSFSNTVTGGSWTSSNTSVASVSATGTVNGVAAGTATISYNVSNSCGTATATKSITVSPTADAGTISGSGSVCMSASTALSASVAAGSWSSSNGAVATVSATGTVTGVGAGIATISYNVTNSCGSATATKSITVSPTADAGTISGSASVCMSASTALSASVAGGSWSSSNGSVATVSATGTVTGVGAGIATISYNVTNSCGSATATKSITVSSTADAGTISGSGSVCMSASTALSASVAGGSWSSSNGAVAAVSISGTVTGVGAGSAIISYNVTSSCGSSTATKSITVSPTADAGIITGSASVCTGVSTALSASVSGGSWSSSNGAVTTVSTSGTVTGVGAGTAIISYNVSNSCGGATATKSITVSPLVDAGTITGSGSVCMGASTALSASVAGGSWSSSNGAVAAVSTSGSVTGVDAGIATISYNVTTSCGSATATKSITVSPLTDAGTISGSGSVCTGASTALSVSITGGSWISSNTAIAAVSATGAVTGAGTGTTTISYNVTNSCGTSTATKSITVTALPDAGTITGSASVCTGASTALSASATGGLWTSSNTSVASVSATGTVTGVGAGIATIFYNVSNSCGSATATKLSTVTPLADAGTITGSTSVCVGASTALSASTAGGSWTSSNTSVASVNATGIVTGAGAGAATISYNVTSSCGTSTATKSITVTALPDAGTITGLASVCMGASSAFSTGVAGGSWTSSNGSIASVGAAGTVTGVGAGVATISYSVNSSCGTSTATKSITVMALPDAGVVSGPASVCAGASISLGSSISGGTWLSGNGSIATVNSLGVVLGVSSGSVFISYVVSNSCGSAAATQAVVVNPAPDAGSIAGASSVCFGLTTTMVSAIAGGVWNSSDASVANIDLTGAVTPVSAGVTTISYTVSNGCGSNTATKSLTVNAVSSGLVGPSNVNIGGNITLTVVGGSWTSSNPAIAIVDGSGNITGLSAGTTAISYQLSNGCYSFITSKVITVNPLAPITGATQVCAGTSITLSTSASGGSWSSGNSAVAAVASSGIVAGVSAGTATISYTLYGTVTTAVVTVNALPSAISGSSTVCQGSSIGLTDAVVGGSWSCSDPSVAAIDAASGMVNGLSVGTAQIQYTLPTGCSITTTVSVSSVNPITGIATLCAGATTTLGNSTSGGTWSSGLPAVATVSATGVVTGIVAGSGIVTYTSASGCIATQSIVVNTSPANISGPTSMCVGTSAAYNNAVSGGTWTTGSSNITLDASGNVAGLTTGAATITYTLSSGCFKTFSLMVNPIPAAISGSATVCVGGSATLTDATTGGTWSSSITAVATISSTGVVTGVAAGSANVTYTLAGSCMTTTSVSVMSGLTAITGNSPVCAGSTLTLSNTYAGGTWSTSNTAVATVDATGIVTGVAGGTARISYIAPGGCNTNVVVTINAIAAITGSTSTCIGTTITLGDATTGGTWSSSDATVATIGSASGIVTGVNNGTTVITYALSTGCARTTTVNIVTMTPITGTLQVCLGLTTSLGNATPGGTWSSSSAGIASVGTSGLVTSGVAGTATISYTASGCRATAVVTVLSSPAAITGSGSVCIGSSIVLNCATTGGTWTTSSTNVSLSGLGTNTLTVTGVTAGTAAITYSAGANGCYRVFTATVNSVPVAIAGTFTVCPGSSASLTDATTGGTWSSANNAIAGVNGAGVVSGVITGTTTISYKISATGCAATAVVTVIAGPSSISGSLNVCTSSTTTLNDSDGTGTWSSSNTAQATVGSLNGVVAGVTAGTSNITFTLAATGCKTKSVVTVTAIPNAGILSGPLSVAVGSTITITSSGTPGGDWSASNTNVTVGSTGIVTGVTAGSVTITYAATNACGYSGAYKPITVAGGTGLRPAQLSSNTPTNIAADVSNTATSVQSAETLSSTVSSPAAAQRSTQQPVSSADVRVVPNPNNGTFTIAGTLGTTESGMVTVEVADVMGRIIYSGKVAITNGVLDQQIEVNIPADGTYLLRVNSANGQNTIHFIVKH
jgi:uncharacterized protein YjdB